MILKNKFFVGQEVYCPLVSEQVKIVSITNYNDHGELFYKTKGEIEYHKIFECSLYESKEAYEAEKNQIRVGDDFYFMDSPADKSEKNRSTLNSILDIIERRDDPVKKLREIKEIVENQINL